MGLLLDRLKQIELSSSSSLNQNEQDQCDLNFDKSSHSIHAPSASSSSSFSSNLISSKQDDILFKATSVKFPDLESIPPELSLQILKYLNATDLCLAACVWSSLANDDILWQSLCKSTWGYASCYNINNDQKVNANNLSVTCFRRIFMKLDEATLTFNADWRKGLDYLFKEKLVEDNPLEIAKFINSTKKLNSEQKEKLFKENKAVLENIVILHNYANQFLPTALRRFFSKIEAPKERNSYLSLLLEKFSRRFVNCNPQLNLGEDAVYILCFSLILLSVDLSSPAVKNKMSKREFIRNTRNALPNLNVDSDFTGHLYDNIYLNGNIAMTPRNEALIRTR